jgi:hypothetical protein
VLKSKTVFVVGAGASYECDLPVGEELALRISGKLDVKFDDWGQKIVVGDSLLFHNVAHNQNYQQYQKAAWLIRDGIILANSIDDFLHIHKGDERVVRYGKAAIAQCILEAERGSKLFFEPSAQRTSIDFKNCSRTWLVKLMRLLARHTSSQDPSAFFGQCSFVVFNYDRCIEYFFIHALQRLYDIQAQQAEEIVSNATILHAYGSAGDLQRVPFGSDRANFAAIGESSIKTYTETVESDAIKEEIAGAQKIIFLGFAYHDPNLQLLAKPKSLPLKSIIGTALGRSKSDRQEIVAQITEWTEDKYTLAQSERVLIEHELKSADIFDHYSKSL